MSWQLLTGAASDKDQHVAQEYRSYQSEPPTGDEPWPYSVLWDVREGCQGEFGPTPDAYRLQGVLLTISEIDALHALAHQEDPNAH